MHPVLREVRPTLALALPIIIGQLSQTLMGVTDTLMIGRTGTVPLAASSFGGSVFGVFYVLGIGLLVPVSVFVSHARGANQPEESGEYLRHGLVLALGFGLLETALAVVLAFNLHWFGQPPEVLAAVNPFFFLISASITPVLVYLALREFAEAMGRPWIPVAIMLLCVGLNAWLNWLLIYGRWGAPALGLTGAGVATVISRVAAVLVIFAWVRRDPRLAPALPRRWIAPLSSRRLREMLRLGVPAAGMLLCECSAFAAAAIMMGWLGAAPLAAHQIALTCASTTFMFPLGLAMAASIRLAAAAGAGERERLRPLGYAALGLGAGIAGIFMLGLVFAGEAIARWFVSDTVVIALAGQLLIVAGLFQFFDAGQVVGAALLRALKDVKIPALVTLVAYWAVAIGGGYVLGFRLGLGSMGIWSALAGGLALAAVLLAWRFRGKTG